MGLNEYRREYALASLRRSDLDANPLVQFQKWIDDATQAKILEPTAMTLATADETGQPSARTVLLKSVDERGSVFCTNYESRKGRELAQNPQAALVFYWKELERQVCVRGKIAKTSSEESELHFKARPAGSQLAAMVSQQSGPVANREFLEKKYHEMANRFHDNNIPRPTNWGGYILSPVTIEFWQGGMNRLHDRFGYSLQNNSTWLMERLAP